jgi:iron complex outermembrane receptor protein
VGQRQIEHIDSTVSQDAGGYFPNLPITQDTHLVATNTTHEVRLQNQERVAGIFDYVVGYFHGKGVADTSLGTRGTILGLGGFFIPGAPTTFLLLPGAAVGGSNPITNTANIVVGTGINNESSFFGNLTVHLGEGTEFSGGARRSNYKDSGQVLFVNGAPVTQAVPTNNSTTIYNFTLRHKFGQDLMVYASTGSSWRPGAHAIGDFSSAQSPNELAHTVISPETSKNYEVGFKSNLLDRKVTFNATYYHQVFKNYTFRAPGGGIYYINCTPPGTSATCGGTASPSVGQFNFITGVPVKVDGVEGEIGFHPSRHFSLNATLNYSKSKIGNTLIACNPAGVALPPTVASLQAALGAEHLGTCTGGGQSATFQPKFTGVLQAEYSASISDRAEGFVRGLFNYRGSGQNDPNNPYDDTKSYGLLNGYVGVRSPNGAWSLTLYGKNLFDVKQVVSLNGSPSSVSQVNVNVGAVPPGPVGSFTYVSRYAGVSITPPREFGVNLRIAFGSR